MVDAVVGQGDAEPCVVGVAQQFRQGLVGGQGCWAVLVQFPELLDEGEAVERVVLVADPFDLGEVGEELGRSGRERQFDRMARAFDPYRTRRAGLGGEVQMRAAADPADQRAELVETKPGDVAAAQHGVVLDAATPVHNLAAEPGDVVLVEAADGEPESEVVVAVGRIEDVVSEAAVGQRIEPAGRAGEQ
nr:hypothetical protein [Nocardia macrotermitis]